MADKHEIFSAGLKKLVKLDGIKDQQEIAAEISKAKSTFNGWVSGRTKTPFDMWEPIAQALGITVDDILRIGEQQLNVHSKTNDGGDTQLQKELLNVYRENARLSDMLRKKEQRIALLEKKLVEDLPAPMEKPSFGNLG